MPTLSDEGLAELLGQPLIAKLATTSEDGDIRMTPLWFRADPDGSIVFSTWKDTGAVTNITRNPRCAALIDTVEWPYYGAHFWGTASVEGPENDEEEIAKMFAPYLVGKMDSREYARMLISWGTRVYVRFRPERRKTWDFRRG